MPVYQLCAVDDDRVQVLGTTDTAIEAIVKLASATETHRRAWVSDETGVDISPHELAAHASAERPNA